MAQWKLIRKVESLSSSPSRNRLDSSLTALSSWPKSRNRVRYSQSATKRAHPLCSNGCGHFHLRRDAPKYATGKCSSPKLSSGHNSPPGAWRRWLKPINPNLQETSTRKSPGLHKKYEVIMRRVVLTFALLPLACLPTLAQKIETENTDRTQ